jgi:hypothetical protein
MALLFMDGFDCYGANYPASIRWGGTGFSKYTYGTAGRFGGYCAAGGVTPTVMQHTLSPALSQVSCGFSINSAGDTSNGCLKFYNGATTICTLFVDSSGNLTFVRGSSIGSNILGQALNVVPVGVWNHIGVEFTRNATTGAVNVYANGVQVISVSGVNTGASDIDSVGLTITQFQFADDYYCVSGATWLGERRIDTLRPSADTAQKDWTPDTGTDNYSRVNETPINGDTSYVTAATVGNKDRYALNDLPINPVTVAAVQALVVARKDDAVTRAIAPVIKSGATEAVGDDFGLASGYGAALKIFETDPNTSSAWTTSGVNALEAGMTVTV